MSKYAKIALLAQAAFLVLGFSVTANAAPPWLTDQEQVIYSAPLAGKYAECMVTNTTDRTIEVSFEFADSGGGTWPSGSFFLVPGFPGVTPFLSLSHVFVHFCKVSWLGQPGEIRAS